MQYKMKEASNQNCHGHFHLGVNNYYILTCVTSTVQKSHTGGGRFPTQQGRGKSERQLSFLVTFDSAYDKLHSTTIIRFEW